MEHIGACFVSSSEPSLHKINQQLLSAYSVLNTILI